MKKLLNTLYIMSSDRYLSLDGENVVVRAEKQEIGRLPLHNLEAIVTCGYTGVSPALMSACVEKNISLSFLNEYGKFLARVTGEQRGNVVLRREQYRIADDEVKSLMIARTMILGKVYNERWVIERATRDYPLRLNKEKLKKVSAVLKASLSQIEACSDMERLRGLEGEAASQYFSVFNDLILQQKNDFFFHGRNKRPPTDRTNAMLSFAYTLLTGMCTSALETVGLDSYVGVMHTDRPGRKSLALDMVEELRSVYADRFVLSLINKKVLAADGFLIWEDGAVRMDQDTRSKFLNAWQEKKKEMITHPFLNEKVEWGMVPYTQALLLARYIRGDLDAYPVFLWK